MKKHFILLILIIMVFTGCSQNDSSGSNDVEKGITKKTITETQIVSLQSPVVDFILKDNVFGISGCHSQLDEASGLMTMYIRANEEPDVDYEAYKVKIWENVGVEFNIVFELIPFPETPTSEGVIRSIEYNDSGSVEEPVCTLLVVSQTSYSTAANDGIFYDADFIKIFNGDLINSNEGEVMGFEDLKIGMYVESYYRGITPAIYPGQQGTENLVIYKDFKMPMASDTMSNDNMEEIFENEDMTGPYPIVLKGFSNLFVDDDIRLWVHLDAGGMVYYKDMDTLTEPGVFMGPLMIYYANDNSANTEDKIPDVVIKAGEDINFNSRDGVIYFDVTVLKNSSLQNVKYMIDENGNLKSSE